MGIGLNNGNLTLTGNLNANGVDTVVEPTIDMSNLFGTQFSNDNVAVLNSAQLTFGYDSLEITGAQASTSNFSFADAEVQNNGVYGVVVQQGTNPATGNLLTVNNIIDYTFVDQNGVPIPGDTFQAELTAWNDQGAIFQILNPFVIPSSAPQQDGSVFATLPPSEQTGANQTQYIYFSYNNLDVTAAANNAQNPPGTPPTFPIVLGDQGTSQFLNANGTDANGNPTPPPNPQVFIPPQTCFVPGTLIRTARGDVAVEALRPGDLVITTDGELLPVRRIGMWEVDPADPDHAGAGPVEIAAHAFGPGLPEMPLFLSADHAVFIDGFLVPVRFLINGGSIRRHPLGAASRYHHVLLDSHAVLFANGLPAESYLDTGHAASGAWPFPVASASVTSVVMAWEAKAYAPSLVAGPALRSIRDRLARLADLSSPSAAAA